MSFCHLHVHTQYSILDGAASIPALIAKAKEENMPALAITDHGFMYGVKEFYNVARKNGIKPILGCETYVAHRSLQSHEGKIDASGWHLILLAKNLTGYQNLIKMISVAATEGFYYRPRVDKQLLAQYHEGIIATSACIAGEIQKAILAGDMTAAEDALKGYLDIFGEDFYIEVQRHETNDPEADMEVFKNQQIAIAGLKTLAAKYNVKMVATNDIHFVNAEDADAHERLICLSTGKDIDDPNRLRYTKQEYFKTEEEMRNIFSDMTEVIDNTMEIVEKIEEYELDKAPIMPDFEIPEGFADKNEYLRHQTYEGAKKRWGDNLTDECRERIDFELATIAKMGFPGYFLIVQDFLDEARRIGVSVGPGRGSAAGSAVAYCLRITDIDPLKYNLLFERFLNVERISMPDIDIDFDEDGREEVLKYVVDKYGADKVAHIITFGTMAAKGAIRDVGRVQKLPLKTAIEITKLIPERPSITLSEAYKEVPELDALRNSDNPLIKQTLQYAETLEGSVRQTGVHACGIIIAKDSLDKFIPVCTAKDTDLLATQYEGSHVEPVGLLKMDFLGLRTLSIIKDTISNIKKSQGVDIDISAIPLDDEITFELFSRAETTGIFQFESVGMKRYLRELKPNRFEDLIAMNALYRPGPMEYIPQFIRRKHGEEPIEYAIPDMGKYLSETYGITVYQEQVMLLSQLLAGFTKGQADSLRKAMGKKKKDLMESLKEKFFAGCEQNGHDKKVVDQIWKDWEAFAQYAFNKSHSTCYAYVAYQTGYLKAHYPAEFMAAVLSRNSSDIKKITTLMDETRRMGINVLGPDINESDVGFTVNKQGNIRFGLGGIRGFGESASLQILEERARGGEYKSIYDFASRVNLQAINKKSFESLALAGAFDNCDTFKREDYFATDKKGTTFIEDLLRFGSNMKVIKQESANTLFGSMDQGFDIVKPKPAESVEWSKYDKLNKEKEVVGIYLSSHPLDDYRLEIETFTTHSISEVQDFSKLKNREITIAGIVAEAFRGKSKTGKDYGSLVVQDYNDSYKFFLFGDDFINFNKYLIPEMFLMITGKVQPRFNNSTEYEIKVTRILPLSNVMEELVKQLTITIDITSINSELLFLLNDYAASHKGKTELRFLFTDREDKIAPVAMVSRTHKIKVANELFSILDEYSSTTSGGVAYRIN